MSERRAVLAREGEVPPGGASWARWYALVLGALAAEVVLFYLFTRVFS
ncbi:MAG: hypothetical protein HRF46_03375 [Acidobacteriota bacterium]